MTWTNGIAMFSAGVTAMLGFIAIGRSMRSDRALDVATNVKTTFDAQAVLVQDLQEETARLRVDLLRCEERHRDTAAELALAHAEIDTLNRRVSILEHQLRPPG